MQSLITSILANIESVVLGKPNECRLALACLLAQGHLLIEDLPGMGKTTLAQTLAKTLGLSFQRTQFTSDLLPADIIGVSIFNSENKQFELHQGAIFNQVVLADEINRASPKTQSALLEAMEEKQVSVDGTTYPLPTPFFVIATQNPLFHAGTYPLPESQLDRFMMRISLGFPDVIAEKKILRSGISALASLNTNDFHQSLSISIEDLHSMQKAVQHVSATDNIIEYIIALCHVSRGHVCGNEPISCNPLSPRAGKSLLSAAKAWAFIDNRDYVLPEDIQAVFYSVCQHRLDSLTNTFSKQNPLASAKDNQHIADTILHSVDVLNPL